MEKNKQYYDNTDWTAKKVHEEIDAGLDLLRKIDRKIITFFGSHRVTPDTEYYQHCKKLANELGKKDLLF